MIVLFIIRLTKMNSRFTGLAKVRRRTHRYVHEYKNRNDVGIDVRVVLK